MTLEGVKRLASDTLTREAIGRGVAGFAKRYGAGSGTVYDIGGSYRHPYKKHFRRYLTVNNDPAERPDIVGDAERLPLRSGSVGCVICVALLEHVERPEAVMSEMARVLRPGGHAYVWVPFYWREHNYPVDNRRYTARGIARELERHGLAVRSVASKPYSGLFFVMAHSVRFMMDDPHGCRGYDPLLYLHALFCGLTWFDRRFGLEYPHLYTGVEVVVEKQVQRRR